MSKEEFKTFVRSNPNLVKYVNNNTMTWQKFYDMYELYGSDNEVWNKYKNIDSNLNKSTTNDKALKELINTVKGINLEKVQKGIDNIQKTISLVQDLGIGGAIGASANQYEKRPIYKHFDD